MLASGYAWFVATAMLPYGIALIVAWRFWPPVVARLQESGFLLVPSAPGESRRLDVIWRLAAAGVIGSGLQALIAPLMGGLLVSWSAVEDLVQYGDWGALPAVGAALVGVALECVVLVAVWYRVRWSRVRARFGVGRTAAFRPLVSIGLLQWWVWPVIVLGIPISLMSAREMARMEYEAHVPFTLGALLAEPASFFAANWVVIYAALSGIFAVAAYGYALWVAFGIVSWFERGHRSYLRTRAWIADAVVIVTLTGLLGAGLYYVLIATASVVLFVMTGWLQTGGATDQSMPLPPCVARDGASMGVVAAWTLLPLLALPVARRLSTMVSRDALTRNLAWYPSGREARLLWLTGATWLVWPYTLAEDACALGLVDTVPGYVIFGIVALVAVLVVTVLIRHASEKES